MGPNQGVVLFVDQLEEWVSFGDPEEASHAARALLELSAGFQPSCAEPETYEALFCEDRASIIRNDVALTTTMEMIVSPDGLNVFPEDVERMLDAVGGVRESAVIAKKQGAREHVHAVLVLDGAG